ncbi:Hsp33 family molecular chaperone HslO [Sulfuriroseicoccus oceanibius]|uniref:Hsp33 family molecular chaperone HslO n=1 Tax=Sulfuriroseicoccus oceanibius TaxID=2707525 RepID=A0A6B3L9Y3_9BACT|nr:Hsp33 family molecular chaperone HslO [Sulfuriroseicoccus oceanibius]QQL44506.1 Hsp33 family molecular chaperone HslO [Sulfuriroseicoccus oceanibius]
MSESKSIDPRDALSHVEIRCYFVRHRNALLVRGDFGELYMDYYLHWMQHGIQLETECDVVLKESLAALTLHMASKPYDETAAWTINFVDPRMNVFVTGNNGEGSVTGRVWTHDLQAMHKGLFIAEAQKLTSGESRRSTVEIKRDGARPFDAAQDFYQQSEQRMARFFAYGPEDFVLITAQPDCDIEWLAELTEDDIRELDKKEELSLLETRKYVFDCGCSAERIISRFAGLQEADRKEIFGDDASIRINCPRCAAKIDVTREQFDRILDGPDNA